MKTTKEEISIKSVIKSTPSSASLMRSWEKIYSAFDAEDDARLEKAINKHVLLCKPGKSKNAAAESRDRVDRILANRALRGMK